MKRRIPKETGRTLPDAYVSEMQRTLDAKQAAREEQKATRAPRSYGSALRPWLGGM